MIIAQALAAKVHQMHGTDWVALGLFFVTACLAAVVYKRSAARKGKTGRYVALMLLFGLAGAALLFKSAL